VRPFIYLNFPGGACTHDYRNWSKAFETRHVRNDEPELPQQAVTSTRANIGWHILSCF
jgi:hypothetical protein